ncbi:MAG TPA: hypothetical protein VEC06_09610 [Paucimonas sp.]|nr:hypothetical protein [Paucimonas sp.]
MAVHIVPLPLWTKAATMFATSAAWGEFGPQKLPPIPTWHAIRCEAIPGTVTVVRSETFSRAAVIVAVPAPTAWTVPAAATVAMRDESEFQFTWEVMSLLVPSEYFPIACNWKDEPMFTVALAGTMAIDCSCTDGGCGADDASFLPPQPARIAHGISSKKRMNDRNLSKWHMFPTP